MSRQKDRARLRKRAEKRRKRQEALKAKYPIQLDKSREEHARAAATIEKLLDVRKFNPTAIGGILLVDELERGLTDLLFAKYPWIIDRVKSSIPPPDSAGAQSLIEEFKKMLLAAGTSGKTNELQQAPVLSSGGLKPLPGAKALAMPTFEDTEDEEDTVIVRRDTHTDIDAGANFMAAAFGIQDGA